MNSNTKISELRKQPDFCGFLKLIQGLEVKSSVGRKFFANSIFFTDKTLIIRELVKTQKIISLLQNPELTKVFRCLDEQFCEILDIENSVKNLAKSIVLNDIELFEIKKFALIGQKISESAGSFELVQIPDLSATIHILNPANSCVPTFYIYDAYSAELALLRKQHKAEPTQDKQLKILELEQEIRQILSQNLKPFAENMLVAIEQIAMLDLLIAKAKFAVKYELCQPQIVENHTKYEQIFNPEIKQKIENLGRKYQKIDIAFCNSPTLITGINMGGKTLLLKTLALCQMLCQYGFYVPAQSAEIALVERIMCSFTDEQNQLQGLSSFAAEMQKMNEIITQISENQSVLVLIDELARTTNPKEGSAIVSAMLDILAENDVSSFITTHYDIKTDCRRLQVKGLNTSFEGVKKGHNSSFSILNAIDYQLIADDTNETPQQALKIAELLHTNGVLVKKAKEKLLIS